MKELDVAGIVNQIRKFKQLSRAMLSKHQGLLLLLQSKNSIDASDFSSSDEDLLTLEQRHKGLRRAIEYGKVK